MGVRAGEEKKSRKPQREKSRKENFRAKNSRKPQRENPKENFRDKTRKEKTISTPLGVRVDEKFFSQETLEMKFEERKFSEKKEERKYWSH